MEVKPLDRNKRRLAKCELLEVVGRELLQILCCAGTLEREQSPAIEHFELNLAVLGTLARIPFRQLLLEPRQVTITPAGVSYDIEDVLGVLGDDCVVDNTAMLVEEYRERRVVGFEGR
jgi:hypothetical protein